MAKKAKAQAKRERRLEGDPETSEEDEDSGEIDTTPTVSNEVIMEQVADLHRRYDDGQMDLDTFDETRATLMAQISVD